MFNEPSGNKTEAPQNLAFQAHRTILESIPPGIVACESPEVFVVFVYELIFFSPFYLIDPRFALCLGFANPLPFPTLIFELPKV